MWTNKITILFLGLYVSLLANNYTVGRVISMLQDHENLDLEKHLKQVNKPPLKTIQKDGYIIDCIDINKQPAFDNPLLKNHKIQLKPSFEVTTTESTKLSRIGFEENLCPSGTVPIRRKTKDDLIRAKQLSRMDTGILNEEIPGRHYAGLRLKENDRRYLGINGIINIYNLPVQNPDQITSAYIYLQQGGVNDRNIIMAGWEVHPKVFGDGRTYFFIRWADKSQNKGCTNLLCPGFVQIDNSYPLYNPVITQTSTYNGDQFEMSVGINYDPETNNWWVKVQDKNLGYYPGILFSNLAFAKGGGWTGMTSTPEGILSPPMGSGHFPDNTLIRSCYIRQMNFQTDNMTNVGPTPFTYAVPYIDNLNCFRVSYQGYNDKFQGFSMLFGGPGGNCGQ